MTESILVGFLLFFYAVVMAEVAVRIKVLSEDHAVEAKTAFVVLTPSAMYFNDWEEATIVLVVGGLALGMLAEVIVRVAIAIIANIRK